MRSVIHPAGRAAAVIALALLVGIPAAAAQSGHGLQACVPVTEDEVRTLFDRWNASLATLHPDKVARNFAPDAVLLPADGGPPRTDYAEIRDHFVWFLQKEPRMRVESRSIRLGCNVAGDAGTLVVTAKGGATGAPEVLRQRYSIVYEHRDGDWLIAHHHVSAASEARHERPAPGTTAAPGKPEVAGFARRVQPGVGKSQAPTYGWDYRAATWRNGSPEY